MTEIKTYPRYELTCERLSGIPYYPDYRIKDRDNRTEIETVLRKRVKGKYYLWTIREIYFHSHGLKEYRDMNIQNSIRKLIKTAYQCLYLGKVDITLNNTRSESVFGLDSLQISEKERLKLIYG